MTWPHHARPVVAELLRQVHRGSCCCESPHHDRRDRCVDCTRFLQVGVIFAARSPLKLRCVFFAACTRASSCAPPLCHMNSLPRIFTLSSPFGVALVHFVPTVLNMQDVSSLFSSILKSVPRMSTRAVPHIFGVIAVLVANTMLSSSHDNIANRHVGVGSSTAFSLASLSHFSQMCT